MSVYPYMKACNGRVSLSYVIKHRGIIGPKKSGAKLDVWPKVGGIYAPYPYILRGCIGLGKLMTFMELL